MLLLVKQIHNYEYLAIANSINKKRLINTMIIFLFILQSSFAQPYLGGSNSWNGNWILPNVNELATAFSLPSSAQNYQWSSSCSDVSFSNANSNSSNFSVPKTSTCSFVVGQPLHIYFDYTALSGTTQVAQTQLVGDFYVLPYLEAEDANLNVTTVMYPGESVIVHARNLVNGTLPLSPCTKNWAVSTGGILGLATNWQTLVSLPTTGFPTNLQVDLGLSNCGLANNNLTQLNLNTKLRLPVFINPPSQIGCGSVSPNNIVFNVIPPVGASATSYIWTYDPLLLTPVGPLNGPTATFNAILTGYTRVSAQAFASNGISSGSGYSPHFTICCTDATRNLTVSVTNTNSPYLELSGGSINSTNDITATGAATIHAQDEVRLLPGFNAVMGCQVHIYNEGCSGVFNRIAMPFDSVNQIVINHEEDVINNDLSISNQGFVAINNSSILAVSDHNSVEPYTKIMPNPSSGIFTILLGTSEINSSKIHIIDNFGKEILELSSPFNSPIILDLSQYPEGVYALKIDCREKIFTRKIIKE
jgi:hypothetical protein